MSEEMLNELKKMSLYVYMEERISYYKKQYNEAWSTTLRIEKDRDKYIREVLEYQNEIQSLKAQIELLKKENDTLIGGNMWYNREGQRVLTAKDKEIELLEKAVNFYADKDNYGWDDAPTITKRDTGDIYHGKLGGKLARQTKQELEKLRNNKGK